MAVICLICFDRDALRATVRDTYSRVAIEPDGDVHPRRGAG